MIVKNHHYPYHDINWIYDLRLSDFNSLCNFGYPAKYNDNLAGRAYKDHVLMYKLFASGLIAKQSNEACLRYLKLASILGQAHYVLLCNPGKSFDFDIDGLTISALGKKSIDYTIVDNWAKVFCLAMISRDAKAINALSEFKPEQHIKPGVEDIPVDYPFAEFLKGVFDPQADLKTHLTEFMKLSAPEYMPERRQPFIYKIWLPFVNLIVAILSEDEAAYHKGLLEALAYNKDHYDCEDRNHLAHGWVSPYILAAACFAYDQCGYKLPESSPYIPEWLVYRDF